MRLAVAWAAGSGSPAVTATAARTTAREVAAVSRWTPALQVGAGAAARAAPPRPSATRCSSPASASAGRTCVEQRGERRRAAGAGRPVRGCDQVAGQAGAAGPPGGDPEHLAADVGRRAAVARLAGGGLDQAADEPGEGDGVLDPQQRRRRSAPRRSASSPTAGRRSRASRRPGRSRWRGRRRPAGGRRRRRRRARSARPRASAARPGTGSWRSRCRCPARTASSRSAR